MTFLLNNLFLSWNILIILRLFKNRKIPHAAAYENDINKDVKITSIRKNDHNDKTEYRPTSIKEILNWLPSFDIMEVTVHRI